MKQYITCSTKLCSKKKSKTDNFYIKNMIYWIVFRLCLGQTIEKTIYLQENELYQQGLYELFNDNIDHQYSFIDSPKGFYIIDSNLKQENTGKYAINPTNNVTQKQYRNLEDQQGNQQYGILFEDENKRRQLCYNSDISNLDLDICILLDNDGYGYDFIFLDYDTVAISSIQKYFFNVSIFQGETLISQTSFESTTYQTLTTTNIDMMEYQGQKYLLVVGTYPSNQKDSVPVYVLTIQSDYTIEQSPYSFNFMDSIFGIRGSDNGTIFIQGLINQEKYIIILQLQTDEWIEWVLQTQFQQQDNMGFDLGYSTIDGKSFRSFILVSDTYYQLQSIDNETQIQNYHQLQINKESSSKFTKNYLIILQDKQLIISNLKNNIQRINYIKQQILSIDVDFQNDKLIVFTIDEIIKYQIQDIYLAFQGQKTNSLDVITITNGLKQVKIYFRILETSDNNLYQLTNDVNNIYYNSVYSPGPFKIPVPLSGFDPKLQVFTDKQLKLEAKSYQILDARLDKEIPIFQQILVTSGLTTILKQYENYDYTMKQCFQDNQILDLQLDYLIQFNNQ